MNKNLSEEFAENCRYLGLKNLLANYQSIIDTANKKNVGFLEFIYEVVQQEAYSRRERAIKYRLKNSKLPQPYKLLITIPLHMHCFGKDFKIFEQIEDFLFGPAPNTAKR